jgi:PAS domain S-box-containing protein
MVAMNSTRDTGDASGGASAGGAVASAGGVSLRVRVIGLVAMALMPALAGVAWYVADDQDQAVEAAFEKAGVLADSTAASLQWVLDDSRLKLEAVAERHSRGADAACVEAPEPDGRQFLAVTPPQRWRLDGTPACGPQAASTGVPPPWFAQALSAGGTHISSPFQAPGTGRWSVALTLPLRDAQGQPDGVAAKIVDLAQLNQRLFRNVPEGALLAVLDAQHRIVLRSTGFDDRVGRQTPQRFQDAVRDGGVARLAETGIDGVRRLYATRPLEGTGWRVWAALPEDDVLAPWLATRSRTLLAVAGMLVLLALGSWWLLRSTLRPVHALAEAARQVAAGAPRARAPVRGPAEIRDVAVEFNRMLDARDAATAALAASEARFRALTELSSDWYWEQDAELRFVQISDGVGRSLGIDPALHVGRRRWELPGLAGPDASAWAAHREALERRDPFRDFEMRRLAAGGSVHVCVVSGVPVFDEAGRFAGYRGIGRDVSAQRRAEDAARQRETRYRKLIDQLPVGVVEHASDTSITLFNAEACRLLGLSPDQMTGRRAIDPAWRFVDERGATMPLADFPVMRVLSSGQPLQGLVVGIHAHAEVEPTWVHVNGFPEHDAAGAIQRVVVVFIDITARRQAEALRAARDMAELASRAKSAFLSRVSHELRTPLNAVLGFSQLLQVDPSVQASPTAASQTELIRLAGEHLLALVDDLLDLARIEAGEMKVRLEPLDLRAVAAECTAMVGPLADASRVELRLTGTPGAQALAERGRLRQILVNLLTNAVKYNRPGGTVDVAFVAEGSRGGVVVRDTGVGMTPLQLAALFQPFNRLGADALGIEGTGLGLVIAQQLIELMGGALEVRSSPGAGSTFTAWLPRAGSAQALVSTSSIAGAPKNQVG